MKELKNNKDAAEYLAALIQAKEALISSAEGKLGILKRQREKLLSEYNKVVEN